MKKTVSLLMALILALSLILSVALPVFAEEEKGEDEENSTEKIVVTVTKDDWKEILGNWKPTLEYALLKYYSPDKTDEELTEMMENCPNNVLDETKAVIDFMSTDEVFDETAEALNKADLMTSVLTPALRTPYHDALIKVYKKEADAVIVENYIDEIAFNGLVGEYIKKMIPQFRAAAENNLSTDSILVYFAENAETIVEAVKEPIKEFSLKQFKRDLSPLITEKTLSGILQTYLEDNKLAIDSMLKFILNTENDPAEKKEALSEQMEAALITVFSKVIKINTKALRNNKKFSDPIKEFAKSYSEEIAEEFSPYFNNTYASIFSNGGMIFMLVAIVELAVIVVLAVELSKKKKAVRA